MTRFFSSPVLKTLIFLVLFLTIYHSPNTVTLDDHDVASAAASEYWTAHHVAYGVDVVQNVGPLGFISFPDIYSGFLVYEKILPCLLLTLILAALTIYMAWRLPEIKIRIFFIGMVWLFTEPDVQNYLLILFIGYALVLPANMISSLLLIPILVILSLAKSTLFFIAVFILVIASACHFFSRRYALSALLPFAYITLFAIMWVTCGQPLGNIFSYICAELHFSQGYNEALSFFETSSVSIFGFSCLALIYIALLYHRIGLRFRGHDFNNLGILLMEAIIVFAVWKHSFTRADGHVAKFFSFVAVCSPLFLWLPYIRKNAFTKKHVVVRSILLTLIFALCIAGYERTYRFRGPGEIFVSGIEWHKGMALSQIDWSKIRLFGTQRNAIANNAIFLLNMPEQMHKLDNDLARFKNDVQMPHINALTGNQEVSYFGAHPARMLYNNFFYRPMPSTISFAAWNNWIMQKDADFFKEDGIAPHYILYHLESLDTRLPAQDDSLAQLQLLQNYEIAFKEKDEFLLVRRKNAPLITIEPQKSETIHSMDQWVELPPASDPFWLRVNVPDTLTGKVLGALYKPPQYAIEYVLSNGIDFTRKFIPTMARIGFMASPLIITDDDFLTAQTAGQSNSLTHIVKFRLHCVHEAIACANLFTVSASHIKGLQLGSMTDAAHTPD